MTADPKEALTAYGLEGASVRPLGDGMVNYTYLVEGYGKSCVLQDMSSIFKPSVADDFAAVTDHLANNGWEVPALVPTTSGDNFFPGQAGRFWRASTFVESDNAVPVYDMQLMHDMGALLAKFHTSLAEFDYEPRFSLPHFHDTSFYMERLRERLPAIPGEDMRALARDVLAAYEAHPGLPPSKTQLIHADWRASNTLYREGRPFTAIDFDTIMQGSVWMDIGDFIRSAGEEERLRGRALGHAAVSAFCEAYRHLAQPDTDPQIFFLQTADAGKLITLELTARFLADTLGDYFAWENSGHPDHLSFVTERAKLQWSIYQDLVHLKEES